MTSIELKAKEAVTHGLNMIKGLPGKVTIIRTVTRGLWKKSEQKEIARAMLEIFQWDLDSALVSKIVDSPKGFIGEIFAVGAAYSVSSTTSGLGVTAAVVGEETIIGTTVAAVGGAAGVIVAGAAGIVGTTVGYWGLKRHQIRWWSTFLTCLIIRIYRAKVQAMERSKNFGKDLKKPTWEDFQNQAVSEKEGKAIEKDIERFLGFLDCFVIDYAELDREIYKLIQKHTSESARNIDETRI